LNLWILCGNIYKELTGLTVLIFFVLSFGLSLAAVALVLKFSHKKGWFDHANERKIHNGHVPRLGGIGFIIAFSIIAVVICIIVKEAEWGLRYLPCLFALFLIMFFGAYDDFHPLKSRYKLTVQIIAAIIVLIPGYVFKRIAYLDISVLPVPFGYAITFLWIVGVTNAVNLIDGIDGLAGGLSGIIALFFGIIFFAYGKDPQSVLFCAAVVGVILGFLVFNAPLPKAKLFMGDSGSQSLGFLLALLPLLEKENGPANLPVLYAAALLMIPIFDTVAAVWRRLRDRISIFTPDKSHIHHKLMNLGLSDRGVDVVLFSLQIILGVITFISLHLEGLPSLYVLGIAYIIGIGFFGVIHFRNRTVTKNRKQYSS
jgi:UDP-GlcNAc:undecaprenyl-phosphate GlcNAc-1-phosphate transferase